MQRKHQFEIRTPEYLRGFESFQAEESFTGLRNALDHYAPKGNWDVCDVMAGTGIVGEAIERAYSDRIRSLQFVDGSRKMLDALGTSHTKTLATVEHLPFADASFDVILCRAGFNNLEEQEYPKAVQEMLRVLRMDGVLIIQDHFPLSEEQGVVINAIEQSVAGLEERSDTPFIPSVEHFTQIVDDAGGQVVDTNNFLISVNFTKRFESKGLAKAGLEKIVVDLECNPGVLTYVQTAEGLIITSPVVTFTIRKASPPSSNVTY